MLPPARGTARLLRGVMLPDHHEFGQVRKLAEVPPARCRLVCWLGSLQDRRLLALADAESGRCAAFSTWTMPSPMFAGRSG